MGWGQLSGSLDLLIVIFTANGAITLTQPRLDCGSVLDPWEMQLCGFDIFTFTRRTKKHNNKNTNVLQRTWIHMQKEHPYNLFINMTILYIHTDMALNSRLCTGMANTHTKTQDGEVNSNTQGIGDWLLLLYYSLKLSWQQVGMFWLHEQGLHRDPGGFFLEVQITFKCFYNPFPPYQSFLHHLNKLSEELHRTC